MESTQHRPTTTIALAIAVLIFLLFAYIELRIARHPILPLYLLKQRNSLCIGLIAGLVAIVNFNMVYHLSMLFEITFQQSVSLAGAHLLPNSVSPSHLRSCS